MRSRGVFPLTKTEPGSQEVAIPPSLSSRCRAGCVHRIDDDTVLLRAHCLTLFDEVYEFGANRGEIVNPSIDFHDPDFREV